MAHVLLLHSVLGLRPAVVALAARLTAAGHPTLAPDLYGGRSTPDVEEGFRLRAQIGHYELMRLTREAALELPDEAVLAGISMGAGLAGDLWVERPRAAGVIFLSGPGPWRSERFDTESPVAMHMARPDPWDTEEDVEQWIEGALDRPLTVHRYDGVGHNFLDEGGPDFDAAAARLCEAHILAFLGAL